MLLHFALAVALIQAPIPAPTIDVAALIDPIRTKHRLPGMVAAIVDTNGVVAIGACGLRDRDDPARMTTDDPMHLGSCTKSMTATLCAKLVARRELAWTTTVGQTFADWNDVDARWNDVTLEQLLCHRGGVPGDVEPALWAALFTSKDSPREQRERLVHATLRSPPISKPGTKFEYSNTGTTIAGLMAERARRTDFERLMRDELFRPLAMKSAGFGPPGSKDVVDAPRGHRVDGTSVGAGVGADNPPAITPAGRVHASLGDWAKYAALHLRGEKDGGLGIPAALFTAMHTPPKDELDAYAMGWMSLERAWGGRVLTHSGSNTMWFCVAWLAPEKGFGVLVATNQGGEAAMKAADAAAGALIGAWTKRAETPR